MNSVQEDQEEEQVLTLCRCCALVLVNNDSSACRDFHGHDHPGPELPTGLALADLEPTVNPGPGGVRCDAHGGEVLPFGELWRASGG